MTFPVGLFEIGNRQFGIVLESVERFVAEQFLDMVHAGAASQQFGRTAAAKGMRGDPDVEPHLGGIALLTNL